MSKRIYCLLAALIGLTPLTSSARYLSAPKITQDFIPAGKYGRTGSRPLTSARYITIHSTDNRSPGATAAAHAMLLKTGGLKAPHASIHWNSWHFTVDDHSIYQHMPLSERGEHADYNGAGNRYSFGIEMCVNRGGDFRKTVDRTAYLTAWLLQRYKIPLANVVPHAHWRRVRPDGKDIGFKNCPAPLLDHGKPGRKWNAFIKQVDRYLHT